MRTSRTKYCILAILLILVTISAIMLYGYKEYKNCVSDVNDTIFPYDQIDFRELNVKDTHKTQLNIAIIDTGLDVNQLCFKSSNIHYLSLIEYNDDLDNIHGTAIAGVIVNSKMTRQILNNANFYIIRAGSDKDITIDKLTQGIKKAIELNTDIINISLGTYVDDTGMREAIKNALSKNITVICSSGNDFTSKPLYPASYDGVISVASVDRNGLVLLSNNYNNKVTISAPGENIPTGIHGKDNSEVFETGSSASSAIVSCVVGNLKFVNEKLTPDNIKNIFDITSKIITYDNVTNKEQHYGFGVINYRDSILLSKSNVFFTINKYLSK